MSVHLRFGTVSIRELVRRGWNVSDKWVDELVWREFYMMILWHFPHVVSQAFKKSYDRLPWRHDEEQFTRWCEGTTGFPIVDAGMRELNATGFMHNRLRMITSMFLTKYLLIDWRWGEAYFASRLIDYELSSNNGGWQWSAGTGADAAPYFRIFSMSEQTKRFDPSFTYIRKWVPEFQEPTYPPPMVDYDQVRRRCLEFFKNATSAE
jgi:deoxyribodipyrimidine photo-lyase